MDNTTNWTRKNPAVVPFQQDEDPTDSQSQNSGL